MIKLNYSACSSLAVLADKAAAAWNRALSGQVSLLAASVNVANVIINFGAVDRSRDSGRVAQHELRDGTHHITLARDVRWRISAWQRFMGLGDEDALSALLHEFGHALGLPHSNRNSDVMAPDLGTTVISKDEALRFTPLASSPVRISNFSP